MSISKSLVAKAGLRHVWRLSGVILKLKGRVY